MHFDLIDQTIEQSPNRIVTIKHITMGEEYLQDHFPTFPVLPGVMMLEAMVHAARKCIESGPQSSDSPGTPPGPYVLGKVRALKYGTFMPPGSTLRIEVNLQGVLEDGSYDFKGEGKKVGSAIEPGGADLTAVSGRFSLRPVAL